VTRPLTLLAVHAHPDDESISMGGTMARYAAEGARVICVTCTHGEEGEIVVPELDTPENHARLAEIRREEIARSLAHLGSVEHRWLGYRDSGMMGTPANEHPEAFWQADLDEAIGRVVRLIRESQPHVVASYNAFGGYGHPDHIRAAIVAAQGFERAGDAGWYPDQLRGGLKPWQPAKLYETYLALSTNPEVIALLEERGVTRWWVPRDDETEEERLEREERLRRQEAARGPLTTRVDVSSYLEAKHAAMREHVTQLAPDFPFLALTPDDWRRVQPTEDYTLRVSTVGVRIPEDDLFAGLR
jgi:mycothiol conjugate amidase Mca